MRRRSSKPHKHARPPFSIVGTQQAGDNGKSLAPNEHVGVITSGGKQGQMSLAHTGILYAKLGKHLAT
jgi:hypothetical protein